MSEVYQSGPALLRRKQVEARTGLGRSAIYAAAAAGTFPRPIKLGNSRSVAWNSIDVDQWIADQILASRKGAP